MRYLRSEFILIINKYSSYEMMKKIILDSFQPMIVFNLNPEDIMSITSAMLDYKKNFSDIHIDGRKRITSEELYETTCKFKEKHNLKVVIICFEKNILEMNYSEFAAVLKKLSKEHNLVVLAFTMFWMYNFGGSLGTKLNSIFWKYSPLVKSADEIWLCNNVFYSNYDRDIVAIKMNKTANV